MKRHRVAGNSLIPVFAVLFSLMALLVQVGTAQAAPITDCAGCHGMPPLDDASRNIATGGFQGNHLTHQPAAAVANNCAVCHGNGVPAYNNAHRDGNVQMSNNINTSPATGAYSKASPFAQTATPALGTCSSVNCHFEKVTPTWGSANFTYTNSTTNDCDQCHLAAPTDGNHPVAGQKHGTYYGTDTGSCVKCHPDHTIEANKFSHATSAGNRGLQVVFTASPNTGGTYSGNVNYPNYLPSQSPPRNGNCTNLYCHSPGTKATSVDPPNTTATWGGTLDCKGCHKANGPAVTADFMNTGTHQAHVIGNSGTTFSQIKCVTCHAATTTVSMTISDVSRHVNKQVEVAFDNTSSAANGSYNGASAKPGSPSSKAPGSAYASCQTVYCHSRGQAAGGAALAAGDYTTPVWGSAATGKCGTCHGVTSVTEHGGFPGATIQRTISSGSHPKHLSYIYGINDKDMQCAICHANNKANFSSNLSSCGTVCHGTPGTAQNHANYAVNVNIATYFGASATYNGTTKPGDGYSSCVSIYCHSDGQGTPTYAPAVTWGTGSLNCTSCHGSATANGAGGSALSGKHAAHVNNAAVLGTNFGCVDCHNKTVSDNTTLNVTTGTTLHVNKFVNYTGVKAGKGSSLIAGTCSATYCHTSGKKGKAGMVATVEPASPSWTGAALDCKGCHGAQVTPTAGVAFNSIAGEPNYTSGAAGAANANSHQKHVGGAADCVKCHAKTTSTGTAIIAGSVEHVDGTIDARFSKVSPFTTFSGAYTSATKTCSATYCHAGASPVWGNNGTLNCGSCHSGNNALPGKHADHYESATLATSYTATPGNSGTTQYQFQCSSCHGFTISSHANGPISANQAAGIQFGFTSASRKGTYTPGGSVTADGSLNWTNGTCASTYCHSNGNGGNPVNGSFNWSSANGTLNCGGCHNKAGDVTWSGTASHLKHVTAYSGSNTISCNSCHSLTAASNTTLATDKSKHVNKVKDVTFSAWAGGTWSGTTCSNTYCHSNGLNPGAPTHAAISWAAPPTVNCDSCHGSTAANPPASTPHVKHVGTAAGYKFACVKCHARTVKSTADSTTFATISSVHMHLNMVKDVAFDSTVNGSWDGTTCSSTYCHSKGTGGTGQTGDVRPITAGTNPTWSGTLNCGSCHGGGNANGQPEYTNGSLKTNSHAKHPTDCSRCHYGTTTNGTAVTTAANHADKQYNIQPNPTTTITSYTYASTGGTCSGIGVSGLTGRCHFAGNATWGDTLTCAACHDINTLSGAHKRHIGGLNLATIPFYAYTSNQSAGTDTSGDPGAARANWKAYAFGCGNCHPIDRGVYHADDAVEVQLDVRAGVSSLRQKNSSPTTDIAPGTGKIRCSGVYCHSDGKGTFVQTPAWDTQVSTANRCSMCHANSPTGDSHAAHTNYASIHQADIYVGPNYSGKIGATATTTVASSHGDPAQSTTIGCNICHEDTVGNARNKYNASCNSCHSGDTDAAGAARITGLDRHVNGRKNVSFATIQVKSKAQVRPTSFSEYSGVWTRNGGNYKGGPNASTSYDRAKTALDDSMFNSGNCSNISCHNGKSVNWTNDYGKGVSCTICHETL